MELFPVPTNRQLSANLDNLLSLPRAYPAAGNFLFSRIRHSPIHPAFPLPPSALQSPHNQICIQMMCAIELDLDPLLPIPSKMQKEIPDNIAAQRALHARKMRLSEYLLLVPVESVASDIVVGYFFSNNQRKLTSAVHVNPFSIHHTGRFAMDLANNKLILCVHDAVRHLGLRTFTYLHDHSRDYAAGVIPFTGDAIPLLPNNLVWSVTCMAYHTVPPGLFRGPAPSAAPLHSLIDRVLSSIPCSNSDATEPDASPRARPASARRRLDASASPFQRTLAVMAEQHCGTFDAPVFRMDAPPDMSRFFGRYENVTKVATPGEAEVMRRLFAIELQVVSLFALLREPYVALPSHCPHCPPLRFVSKMAALHRAQAYPRARSARLLAVPACTAARGALHGCTAVSAAQKRMRRRVLLERARKRRRLGLGGAAGEGATIAAPDAAPGGGGGV